MKKITVTAAVALMALTACGANEAQKNTVEAPSPTQNNTPSATPSKAAEAKPTATPKPKKDSATKTLPYATVTLLGDKTDKATAEWYGTRYFNIKVCATQPMVLMWEAWSLIDDLDRPTVTAIDPNQTYGAPLPGEQGNPATLQPGRCVRGWLTFINTNKGEDLVGKTLVYGVGQEGGTVEWNLTH